MKIRKYTLKKEQNFNIMKIKFGKSQKFFKKIHRKVKSNYSE